MCTPLSRTLLTLWRIPNSGRELSLILDPGTLAMLTRTDQYIKTSTNSLASRTLQVSAFLHVPWVPPVPASAHRGGGLAWPGRERTVLLVKNHSRETSVWGEALGMTCLLRALVPLSQAKPFPLSAGSPLEGIEIEVASSAA